MAEGGPLMVIDICKVLSHYWARYLIYFTGHTNRSSWPLEPLERFV